MSDKKILYLSSDDVQKSISMIDAINAMEDAFSQLSSGEAKVPLRSHIEISEKNAGALFMPVYLPKNNLIGLKSVSIFTENGSKGLPFIHALIMVLSGETGEPVAVMNGEFLTAIRTGAASGLATKLMSKKNASTGALIGAGVQGEKQIQAVYAVRNISKFYVLDIDINRAKEFVKRISGNMDCELIACDDRSVLKNADIICTATSSKLPVVLRENISEGTHINGIGSYRPDMCEIGASIIQSAKIVVDSRKACLSEAGDLIQPIKNRLINESHIVAELGEIVDNKVKYKFDENDITVFKSVGNAVQDLAVADIVIKNAIKNGYGTFLPL
ncbi:MAG: hypothetical protein JEY94_13055 [Melioribacteraceae bacterium]|nr:hypothetical protein [Melioribacteraceae bacterium]